MDLSQTGRVLVVSALVLAGVGVLFMVAGSLGLGRLPGDVDVRRGHVRVFAPLGTCLLLSILATVVLNLLSRH
ncbi:MAG TPA: DUF2905 domain-containing protein [Acidimicrobiales bacterium]|nr:DUF2905 domain-containing protein [Acidimicrobiales bacterium]